MNAHILKLISAYTTNEISEKQFNDLQQWLNESVENKQMFADYLHFYKKSRRIGLAENLDSDKAWNTILVKLKEPLQPVAAAQNQDFKEPSKPIFALRRKTWFKYAAAAVVVGILASGYFFRYNFFNRSIDDNANTTIIVNNDIQTGTDKATLTLSDGSEVALEKGQKYVANNLSSNGEEIIYEVTSTTKPEIVYNYLTIPRGGQFHITLADGTEVWLNSESQLKYPVAFIDGDIRQVELMYGEAYFDVSPSINHNGAGFKVYHKMQEVQVLGTEFNIKAYKGEINIYTTLVEGKVAIDNDIVVKNLKPSEQSILNIGNKNIIIASVDIYDETSWKSGVFSFKNKPLKDIMKVLSRWYDTEVFFLNKDLEEVRFRGVLSKDQNLEDILLTIKNTNFINAYEINNKKIILK
ncbi:FecR family protein [Changchengzhania lutea]|uniref:FecR family protein n=1 Tax=Changchengzhania lutea TaxID=2049305 RepID=UPI00163DE29C|nr:FecR family protein [Changchengzhania lutea]